MKNYPKAVMESVWRSLRRPSPATRKALYVIEPPHPLPPAPRPYNPPALPPAASKGTRISNHEAQKFALQNTALLRVLEAHEKSLIYLSPSVLDVVKRALAPAGKSRPNIAA